MSPSSPSLHPPQGELELYVMGALEAGPAARLERHVRACGACAAALAEEARFECTLQAMVPRLREAATPPASVLRLPAPPVPVPAAAPVVLAASRRAPRSSALAAAAALLVGVWGLSVDRVDRASGPGLTPAGVTSLARDAEAAVPACEMEGSDAVCRSPLAVAGFSPAVSLEVSWEAAVCRAPVGGVCSIQSRMP